MVYSRIHWPGQSLFLYYDAGKKGAELEFKELKVRVIVQSTNKNQLCDVRVIFLDTLVAQISWSI